MSGPRGGHESTGNRKGRGTRGGRACAGPRENFSHRIFSPHCVVIKFCGDKKCVSVVQKLHIYIYEVLSPQTHRMSLPRESFSLRISKYVVIKFSEGRFCGSSFFARAMVLRGIWLGSFCGLGRRMYNVRLFMRSLGRWVCFRSPAGSSSHPHTAHGFFPFALLAVHAPPLSTMNALYFR